MAKVDVEMPKMGESITEGTIIVWHKQPGDQVEQDEILLEIGTDKVDTEVPSPAEGTLDEILVNEGDTVEVGTIIARLETEAAAAGDGASGDAPDEAAQEAAAEEADDTAPEPAAADASGDEASTGDGADAPEAGDDEAAGELVDIVMPKMGESITEGTIIAWHKQPGDSVEIDEILLEIGTDKVDTEVPSSAAGTLHEQLVDEGDTVEVGTVIARVATGAGAAPAADATGGTGGAADAAPADTSDVDTSAPAAGDGAAQPVPAGDGGPIERRGTDGQFFSPLVRSIAEKEGLSMHELETIDGSGRDGRVTKSDVMDYLDTREAAPTPAQPAQEQEATPGREPSREDAPAEAPAQRSSQPAAAPARPAYTVEDGPSDAEIRQQYGDRVEIQEMDRMRRITAEHMVRSKATSAHVTSFAEADVTGLVNFREKHKAAFQEREGIKLTYTPFFVQAAVEALREHPVLNASVEGDKIVVKKDYHVGIAVAIGTKGLLAPVIRNAGDFNVVGIARRAADIAERARSKQLQPDELQGGTFTVTNIGSLGSLMGTPVINQPQVGILATGAIKKKPVVVEDPAMGDVIAVRHMMYLSLSYDHRIIDGAMGASFLRKVVDELEAIDADSDLL
ncbi:2-oxoglutarate dehydrogenase, E2 component, dihydrolipoamide succinyltransferase [Salisaeta longa]|uniref:2-oxoglutarate dehydrogenase, E2 component, dihydrolipoamide succinyltransferase n=1 Tax=Salisaeta longa TaxID=503170 RepID=UPI0003B49D3C|nr:2-oxoglutarate dehydrogenase, E2 component, dihydrolipoamide succinyltransferase [Salisaeta longa]